MNTHPHGPLGMGRLKLPRHSVIQPEGYRIIPLPHGQNALLDIEDYELISKWTWQTHWNKCTHSFYAIRQQKGKKIYMHRELLGCQGKENEVDHINHDTLDNRRSNLRKVSHQQNAWNRKSNSRNTSGIRGVCKSRGKWVAQLRIDNKRGFLGRFDTKEEAHSAYVKAVKANYGEFGYFDAL